MQKSKNMNLRRIAVGGILASFSIVFGKLLAFNIGEMFRISFENLPIILAGIILGPIFGGVVGLVADVTGCLVVGYAINPIITLGAFAIGATSGLAYKMLKKNHVFTPVFCATLLSHIVGSLLIKTFGLAAFYGTDYFMLLLYRSLNYALIIALECIILYILMKNVAFISIVTNLGGEKE